MTGRAPQPAQTAAAVTARLRAQADPERARGAARFFKTGPGEYGEGDRFVGLTVPAQRVIAKAFRALPPDEVASLLASPVHEDRFTALEILVMQYEDGEPSAREGVYRFYLAHTAGINNWDLVDTSASYIVGAHLLERSRAPAYTLVASPNLWERRIGIVASHRWIASGDTADAYGLAERLLDDTHDLTHKAVGWTLRLAGVKDRGRLVAFLRDHYARVPRTTLRYAIEHFAPAERARVLKGTF